MSAVEAHLRIKLSIIESLLDDPETEFSPHVLEHWDTVHDKLVAALKPPAPAVELTDEWAAEQLSLRSGVHFGPGAVLSIDDFSSHTKQRIADVLTGARAAMKGQP